MSIRCYFACSSHLVNIGSIWKLFTFSDETDSKLQLNNSLSIIHQKTMADHSTCVNGEEGEELKDFDSLVASTVLAIGQFQAHFDDKKFSDDEGILRKVNIM